MAKKTVGNVTEQTRMAAQAAASNAHNMAKKNMNSGVGVKIPGILKG
jgi:hypothetical protein